jgi:hypothetical protein
MQRQNQLFHFFNLLKPASMLHFSEFPFYCNTTADGGG